MFSPLLLLLLAFPLFASTTLETKIHDIDWARNKDERTLVLLETGHVLKAPEDFVSPTKNFKAIRWNVTFDEKHNLLSMMALHADDKPILKSAVLDNYEPSVVDSGDAKKYFNQSRISRGETQCYNRAHIWAFELWKNHQVKSQKIFLFFTRKYIRRTNFGWWFHVSPLVVAKDWLGNSDDRVMDARYITAPRSVDWWTSKFLASGTECKEITKYSEYADYPYTEDCLTLKAPMYYYQPQDLEMLEVWGVSKNEFALQDLQWAYKEAFQVDYQGDPL